MEKYYKQEYQNRQFAVEQPEVSEPDLRIADGNNLVGKQILSIGCGAGHDVSYLTSANQVFGIDIMPRAVEMASLNGIEAIESNVENGLPYSDAKFDIVICKDVLEHLINPKSLLENIYRVLNENGYAFIVVPNHFWYWQRLRILRGKGMVLWEHSNWHDWDYFHIRFFTFNSFNELIRESKFKVTKYYYPDNIADILAPGKLKKLNFLVPKKVAVWLCKQMPNLLCTKFCVRIQKSSQLVENAN